MIDLPFPDVPKRPLRAVRNLVRPRQHLRACHHAWPEVRPTEWTDDQRARARAWHTPVALSEYTPDCPACDDLIAWHQERNRLTLAHRSATLPS